MPFILKRFPPKGPSKALIGVTTRYLTVKTRHYTTAITTVKALNTLDEKVYPIVILSHNPQPSLQLKCSQNGYTSTLLNPTKSQSHAISEIRSLTKTMYKPIFIAYHQHCLLLQKYLESHGCSATVFIEPKIGSDPLYLSLLETPVKLESCQDTFLQMLTVSKEKGEIVDRLGTEYLVLEDGYESRVLEWLDIVC
jgi:hypothetical protein